MSIKNKRLLSMGLLLIMLIGIFIPGNVSAEKDEKRKEAGNGKLFTVGVDKDTGDLKLSGEGFEKTKEDSWKRILSQLKYFIGGFSAVALILIVGAFIIQFVKLANVGDNPNKRKEITTGITWTFVATALLGSVAAIVAIAYKFF